MNGRAPRLAPLLALLACAPLAGSLAPDESYRGPRAGEGARVDRAVNLSRECARRLRQQARDEANRGKRAGAS